MAELKTFLGGSLGICGNSGIDSLPELCFQFLKGRFARFYLPSQLPEAIYALCPWKEVSLEDTETPCDHYKEDLA